MPDPRLALNFSGSPVKSDRRGEPAAARTPGQDVSPLEDFADRDHRGFARVDERDFTDHRRAVYVGLHMSTENMDNLPDGGRHHHHRRHHHSSSRGHHGHRHHHDGGRGHHRHQRHHKHRHRSDSAVSGTPSLFQDNTPAQGPSERVRTLLSHDPDQVGHETHDLFTELEELRVEGGVMEWKETARWVKYEEDVEWGGEKWSKPHVAALSLHSLFELRSCVLQGTVLLNMEASDLTTIADLVLDDLIATSQLEEVNRELVRRALLCRHTHQHESHHRPKLLRRNTSEDQHKMAPLKAKDAAANAGDPASASTANGSVLGTDHTQLRQNSMMDGESPATGRKQHIVSQGNVMGSAGRTCQGQQHPNVSESASYCEAYVTGKEECCYRPYSTVWL